MNYTVQIFKDKKENLRIVPYGFDENGIGRGIQMALIELMKMKKKF